MEQSTLDITESISLPIFKRKLKHYLISLYCVGDKSFHYIYCLMYCINVYSLVKLIKYMYSWIVTSVGVALWSCRTWCASSLILLRTILPYLNLFSIHLLHGALWKVRGTVLLVTLAGFCRRLESDIYLSVVNIYFIEPTRHESPLRPGLQHSDR